MSGFRPEVGSLAISSLFGVAILCCALFLASTLSAFPLDFTTIRLGSGPNAVLVFGGIQGDEPGGFSAATLLATRYEISRGSVWVAPNLNFPSIIRRSRGLHGDMNRKFSRLDENDPEFATVRRIQSLILHPDVGLVLNLHDGSGYYRPEFEDKLRNPARWGQSIIIDQDELGSGIFMGRLAHHARAVVQMVNQSLLEPVHALHVHNTNTAAGDREMEKSLSYYAVRNGRAAFGLEASKEFPVAWRAYYHLGMIEAFLRLAGVEFSRDFELTPAGVEAALAENLGVSFAGNRIFLPLEDARPTINCLPLPRNGAVNAIMSKPIMAVLPCEDDKQKICIHYGNRKVTLIRPDWREVDEDLDAMRAIVDGKPSLAPFGHILDVVDSIIIEPVPGFRVNAIGYGRGTADEAGKRLSRNDFETRYSVDKGGNIFRVEVYKDKKIAGMFLLRFATKNGSGQAATLIQPDVAGPESSLGF